jgi:hypothetical protein
MKLGHLFIVCLTAMLLLGANQASAAYFNGFETDIAGWDAFGGSFNASRVASGTNGVTSADGSFHGISTGPSNAPATNWGGYSSVFPAGGYRTSVDIYLDPTAIPANDTRFDFTSAVNKPDGSHRRDFAFNVGGYTSGGNHFTMSASNSTGRANSFPTNPARDPFDITSAGWYTFQHDFTDNGTGVLSVQLRLLDSSDALLHTWTLSDPTDVIGSTVGGNRYGWFANTEFSSLAFDNSSLTNLPEPASLGLLALGGLVLARRTRRQSVSA